MGNTPPTVPEQSQPPELNGYLPAAAMFVAGVALVGLIALLRYPTPARPAM
ncbi:MAG: hypothetical protein ACOC9Y_02325 [Chloroflexota bacterium]